MNQHFRWVSEKEAGEIFGVDEKTLEFWREVGYLKPGTHWRSSTESDQLPWKPRVFYHIAWCREVIEYWKDNDASSDQVAA